MSKKVYFAKSNPKETLQAHTDKLLKNLNILKNLYPNLFINWDILYMLKLVCIYHDMGKINEEFQKMINGNRVKQSLPHGVFSLCFLDTDDLYDEVADRFSTEEKNEEIIEKKTVNLIKILVNAIAYHHEREIPKDYKEIITKNLESLQRQLEGFEYDKININKVKNIDDEYFTSGNRIMPNKDSEIYEKYILIKGLLNRIDYAASAGEEIEVEKENNFLTESLEKLLNEWQKKKSDSSWNELQNYMIENRDENIIAIAQTGMGKTEAGLLWIGDTKGFFILPLKTAINSIYYRVRDGIVKENIEDKVGLLHSDTKDIYIENISESDIFDIYYESTRQLSLPLTICTLDQIFDFVYRYKGFEPKLATLSYSKIVLDEIQMYSPELLAYVIKGLKDITKMGGKFSIITATFPKFIEEFLRKEGIEFKVSPEFTKKDLPLRHRVEVLEEKINSDFIIERYQKNKVLIICNTVKEAQRVFEELLEKIEDKERVHLFHSKFIKKDRKLKEKRILELGSKENKDYGIWVATQVVEASLDIDFDILFTELSDLNGLFQRMGRCYRNRPLQDEITNCYVFIGNDKQKNTGIGSVIDKEIYSLSRDYLKEKLQGSLDEKMKMLAISELYTTEKLEKTEYYGQVKRVLEYLDKIIAYEYEKKDVREMFRDITNYEVIPESRYEENRSEIEKLGEIINLEYTPNLDKESRKKLKREKVLAKIRLKEFTMSVSGYEIDKKALVKSKMLELGNYERIYILECNYSLERGYQKIKIEEETVFLDRCF
ncbi:CRISPR-associated helicase Cas3' [uncultured Fusobacterium sp.]|uniref:CRISPR-associated helicase Cas3' n=1 Tax=uncultured Fusobacterium sp. TaxID=159267 RepID=UPI0025E038C1|nr:CRISPR-associated helicase Cas3' [uncultured Fusobacterium sp.]